VLHGKLVIAEHARSWGRRQVIERPEHRAALVARRRAARDLKGRDRLRASRRCSTASSSAGAAPGRALAAACPARSSQVFRDATEEQRPK
jgi:hypothetical protein